jgi:tRNA uridine 5-carboxymethylaminomethyl modification enzyme
VKSQTAGGRVGEKSAVHLSDALRRAGLKLGRFKTGTPPRLERASVDTTRCEPSPGEDPPLPFSFRNQMVTNPQVLCWLTATNAAVHALIRENLHRSPLYAGRIEGLGPRYCPSVEDKVVKFADRAAHTIFLEPEGIDSDVMYVNGLSTSLPEDVAARDPEGDPGAREREDAAGGIRGRVRLRLSRPAPADARVPRRGRSLSRGTDQRHFGIREAAAQGFWAGVNAASALLGREPFLLGRDEAYMGVLVDDLVSVGVEEPYRMFTSRAEYRLLLGIDTVLPRLLPKGHSLGLVSEGELEQGLRPEHRIRAALNAFQEDALRPDRATLAALEEAGAPAIPAPTTRFKYIQRQDVGIEVAGRVWPGLRWLVAGGAIDSRDTDQVRRVHSARGGAGAGLSGLDAEAIPDGVEYSEVRGFPGGRREVLRRRPETLGAAARSRA